MKYYILININMFYNRTIDAILITVFIFNMNSLSEFCIQFQTSLFFEKHYEHFIF